MNIARFHIRLVFFLLFVVVCNLKAKSEIPEIKRGVFEPDNASLKQFECPEWFRDAKFGIWSHWGPQAVPRQGDWYARNLYQNDNFDRRKRVFTGVPHRQNTHHLKHYGHPSEFGYKDIIPLWKAEKWNPDQLMKLFKKTGARYFVSMAVHHDNFFLWNSKIHRWNSVNMGPQKDVVGLWQKAARKEGLKFGVSEHLAASYTWYQTSKLADRTGDKAGVPYDGNDPCFEDLYHAKADPDDYEWLTKNPVWHRQWFDRIKELVDMYKPDLLYSDSKMPFDHYGRSLVAHFYNQSMADNKNKLQAVYTCKENSEGRFVHDVERGVMSDIQEFPWQTDTSIGDWYYRTGQPYKSSKEVIQMLVDIVSKNGNLLLNVVQTPEGDIEEDVLRILDQIGTWIKDNGEGIYGTRPWKVYGEGPSTTEAQEKGQYGGLKEVRPYQSTDIRYTRKGNDIYVFCMEKTGGVVSLKSLGMNAGLLDGDIASVSMPSHKGRIQWSHSAQSLDIQIPSDLPDYDVIMFKISTKINK